MSSLHTCGVGRPHYLLSLSWVTHLHLSISSFLLRLCRAGVVIVAESGLSLFSAAEAPTRCGGGVVCTAVDTIVGRRCLVLPPCCCCPRVLLWCVRVAPPSFDPRNHAPASGGEGGGHSSRFLRSSVFRQLLSLRFHIISFISRSQAISRRLARYNHRRGG